METSGQAGERLSRQLRFRLQIRHFAHFALFSDVSYLPYFERLSQLAREPTSQIERIFLDQKNIPEEFGTL